MSDNISFTELALQRGDLRVTWEWIGEGWSGDYDADDPEDEPLLRFTVDKEVTMGNESGWEQYDDGSYCTRMPVKTPTRILVDALGVILEAAEDSLQNGSFKKRMEELSWLCPDDFLEE
jgi:hypothetical protein